MNVVMRNKTYTLTPEQYRFLNYVWSNGGRSDISRIFRTGLYYESDRKFLMSIREKYKDGYKKNTHVKIFKTTFKMKYEVCI